MGYSTKRAPILDEPMLLYKSSREKEESGKNTFRQINPDPKTAGWM